MRTRESSHDTHDRRGAGFVAIDSRVARPRSVHLTNSSGRSVQHRDFVRSTPVSPTTWNEKAEFLADIDGFPILMRFLVQDVPAEIRARSTEIDIRSRLSSTLEKLVDRMRGSSLQHEKLSKQPFAIVELISNGESLIEPAPLSNETVLRVGPLELDLIDRTAKRGDRQIELRPREFRLLKYMMERSNELLTRATLLKDVWHYKFVPETNLVDVHMGRLRRKVDGANESHLIRNVRGVGFILSAPPPL
jgi:DNA-binding response OmpR family regulator